MPENIKLNDDEEECFRVYGCVLCSLPRNDDIVVGQHLSVVVGCTAVEAVILSKQRIGEIQDGYILARTDSMSEKRETTSK